ncbi:MAG: DUF1080 domain-containing protein [Flavisolibacter sp.]
MRNYLPFLLCGLLFSLFAWSQKKSGGWQNLFDGKSLHGWKKLAGSANYEVADGAIVGSTVAGSGNTFLATEKEYGNFILELDIKIESVKGNSGIQTRSHYNATANGGKGLVYGRQVEVDPSERKWSGGIYDEGRRKWLYPLSLNPGAQNAFLINQYNHYKIECIGNEIKTWLNGTAVADLIDTLDQAGFIALQVHAIGDPSEANKKIFFKNIRIKTSGLKPQPFPTGIYVVNYIPNFLSAYEKRDGWKLLFDGKSSNGWESARNKEFPKKGWAIQGGLISVQPSQGKEAANGGDIITKQQYGSFDLSFDFRLSPGANSGVKYFVTLAENTSGSAIGLEYQVLDDSLHPDAKLGRNGNRTLASLYDLIASNKPSSVVRPIGQWNTGRVVVYPDNKVEHYLNGIKVLQYTRGSVEFKELVAMSKFKDWPHFGEAPEGHILLQDHGDAVSYRSIKIKVLK